MEGEHQPGHPEIEGRVGNPRIYAASLTDYTNGRLHGEWIYADQEPDDLQAEIDEMLAASIYPEAEEWAIHDYEGFGVFELSEHESLSVVARVAGGIATKGAIFAHWVHAVGTEAADAQSFDDAYLGTWESLADYAEHFLDDMGWKVEDIVPDWISAYIRVDYDGLGAALATDLHVGGDGDGVHLFAVST
ncbi:MAG: antirestriction protein ArdA [Actinomycetota bacterium]